MLDAVQTPGGDGPLTGNEGEVTLSSSSAAVAECGTAPALRSACKVNEPNSAAVGTLSADSQGRLDQDEQVSPTFCRLAQSHSDSAMDRSDCCSSKSLERSKSFSDCMDDSQLVQERVSRSRQARVLSGRRGSSFAKSRRKEGLENLTPGGIPTTPGVITSGTKTPSEFCNGRAVPVALPSSVEIPSSAPSLRPPGPTGKLGAQKVLASLFIGIFGGRQPSAQDAALREAARSGVPLGAGLRPNFIARRQFVVNCPNPSLTTSHPAAPIPYSAPPPIPALPALPSLACQLGHFCLAPSASPCAGADARVRLQEGCLRRGVLPGSRPLLTQLHKQHRQVDSSPHEGLGGDSDEEVRVCLCKKCLSLPSGLVGPALP